VLNLEVITGVCNLTRQDGLHLQKTTTTTGNLLTFLVVKQRSEVVFTCEVSGLLWKMFGLVFVF